MKRKDLRILSVVLSLSIIMSMVVTNSAFALSGGSAVSGKDAIYQTVEAMNLQDWKTYVDLQCKDNKSDYETFLENKDNKVEQVGLFNIISAKVFEIKQLRLEEVTAFTKIDEYQRNFENVAAFYVGIDYAVHKESKYYFNGVNYDLVIVGQEDGIWKIIEMSDAPIESFTSMGLGFGSKEEEKALRIIEARISGMIIGSNGDCIFRLSTAVATDEHARPDDVRVYRVNLGRTESVDLYSYVKNVLPNEWYSSWSSESLKSGAMATKMYGWYHTYHPKWASLNADVKDTTADQVYIPNTEVTSTTSAINAINGIGLENSSGNIFETQYLAGTSGSAGSANTGKISQWGSKYLSDNGHGYLYICRYYYNNSDKSSGTVNTFTY